MLIARGSWFLTEKDGPLPGLYFRMTFAAASENDMREAVRRVGEALRETFDDEGGKAEH